MAARGSWIYLAPVGNVIRVGLALALLMACGGQGFERRLSYGELSSRAMNGRAMRYAVYTPPGYVRGERLPLVVFLHGGGDDEASFDRHGLSARLDEATRAGRIPRVVMVMPQGELGFWANWYDGSAGYEDWVMREVVPRVAFDYETLPCPDWCHVMGVSMGGSGTIRFALHHDWASATMISAPVLDTEQMINLARNPLFQPMIPMDRIFGPTHGEEARARVRADDPFLRWSDADALEGMRLMVAWGDADRGPIADTSRRFVAHLEENEVPHEHLEYDGNHSWISWNPVIEEALRRMVTPSPWATGRARPDPGATLAVDARR